ncbi:MAG: response regulator [Pirellula sp.]|jgi:DNA-binding response OmpR family regulator|nr:response regulator [Pirellula sp.]
MSQQSERSKILLVEDEPVLGAMVMDYLQEQGFEVALESRGDIAIERIMNEAPDAVILDINLPGCDGFEVCRQVRDRYSGTIVMLTARASEVDEVFGLECGADDYLSKPVRPKVLLARLRIHLRKHQTADSSVTGPFRVGDLLVDPASRRVELSGQEVEVSSAEFDVLQLLAASAGKTLSRAEIFQAIHGMKFDGLDRSIDLRISRLRKKLGDDPLHPKRIKSIRGTGYLLALDP